MNLMTYSLFWLCYFAFINTGVSALRIRMLRELYDSPDGLTMDEILIRYNSKEIIESWIDKEGIEYTRFKTATIDLEPYGIGLLEAYWSTKGIPIGEYDLDLTIFYDGKTTNKLVEAEVNIDSIKTENFIVGKAISGKGKIGRSPR